MPRLPNAENRLRILESIVKDVRQLEAEETSERLKAVWDSLEHSVRYSITLIKKSERIHRENSI